MRFGGEKVEGERGEKEGDAHSVEIGELGS